MIVVVRGFNKYLGVMLGGLLHTGSCEWIVTNFVNCGYLREICAEKYQPVNESGKFSRGQGGMVSSPEDRCLGKGIRVGL